MSTVGWNKRGFTGEGDWESKQEEMIVICQKIVLTEDSRGKITVIANELLFIKERHKHRTLHIQICSQKQNTI